MQFIEVLDELLMRVRDPRRKPLDAHLRRRTIEIPAPQQRGFIFNGKLFGGREIHNGARARHFPCEEDQFFMLVEDRASE